MKNNNSRILLEGFKKRCEQESVVSRDKMFYERLLSVQAYAEDHIGTLQPELNEESIKNRLARGIQLLTFKDLDIDWVFAEDVSAKVFTVFEDFAGFLGFDNVEFSQFEYHPWFIRETVEAWFDRTDLCHVVAEPKFDKRILLLLIQETLRPFMIKYAQTLNGSVDQEKWRRSFCPICGGSADFSFLQKGAGERWLLCARCEAEWLFQRIECPYCGNTDHNSLSFSTNSKEVYRLYACDNCGIYLKAVDLRKKEGPVLIPLERLMTLNNGYKADGAMRHSVQNIRTIPSSK